MADLDEVIAGRDFESRGHSRHVSPGLDLDHLAQTSLPHLAQEGLDDPQVDVGLQEGDPDLAQGLGDVLLAQDRTALELEAGIAEALGEGLEHGGLAEG